MTANSAKGPVTLPKPRTEADDERLTGVRGYVIAGFLALFGLFGGLGGWAASTDLAGAVLAPGHIVVASSVKKVQHPTGGVVGQINVRNGDHVKAGDLLVRLDETVTRANLQLVTSQIDELLGRKARLAAERDDKSSVTFPPELTTRESEPSIAQIISGEQKLFEQRVSTRKNQYDQLGQRIAGIEVEISGLASQVKAKAREIELIAKELASLEKLEIKQLVTTSKMMALRREAARLEGENAQLTASIGQGKQRIAEIEIQRLAIDSEAKSEVIKELREAEGKLAEFGERRTAAQDQLKRIDIRSPVDGIVHQASVVTVGGVINTSEPLMLIVPEGDKLIIEAKIAPKDIDLARSNTTATVRLTAFDHATTPTIAANVINIAADLTRDDRTGIEYYVGRLEVPDSELTRIGKAKLFPGMPVEVQIKTGYRSAWSYLMKPLQDQFSKAFKER